MVQSLVRLPENADIKIGRWYVSIKNHRVVTTCGLLGRILGMIDDPDTDIGILSEFEKHGVSYEAVIEECVAEFDRISVIKYIMRFVYKFKMNGVYVEEDQEIFNSFSKSDIGVTLEDKLVDKIRSCRNWDELYNEFHSTSKFSIDLKKIIKEEITQWHKT